MILLTTPDYLPKLGGLSSHTLNVEKVLKELGFKYDLFHWKNYQEVLNFDAKKLDQYDFIINIHSGFHMYMPKCRGQVINFVNGAEILFYSDNPLKNFIKKVTKKRSINRLETAKFNIFISDFTFKTLQGKGLTPDYSRDLIYHMVVDTQGHTRVQKEWDTNPLTFICVARDVPHKNFAGVINFCEEVQDLSNRRVELITVTNKVMTSDKIRITSYVNPDNAKRDELLAGAHINLLLSLDQSYRGFFEGFGQIVQEAGCFATPSLVLASGGLPESVHKDFTGWVLPDLSIDSVRAWWNQMDSQTYRRISDQCYEHTLLSHGLPTWKRLFQNVVTP